MLFKSSGNDQNNLEKADTRADYIFESDVPRGATDGLAILCAEHLVDLSAGSGSKEECTLIFIHIDLAACFPCSVCHIKCKEECTFIFIPVRAQQVSPGTMHLKLFTSARIGQASCKALPHKARFRHSQKCTNQVRHVEGRTKRAIIRIANRRQTC